MKTFHIRTKKEDKVGDYLFVHKFFCIINTKITMIRFIYYCLVLMYFM